MIGLFPSPLKRLSLGDLRAFLEEAGEESLIWDAKAGDEHGKLHPGSVRKAACGFANQIGGYVILGARWDGSTKEWTLPGVAVPDPEPALWVGKMLRQLNPVPRFESKAWALDEGRRTIAVVRVEPVAIPPCMTPGGRVYERVSGETVPVEDPALLRRLFERGNDARDRAEGFAVRAAVRAGSSSGWPEKPAVRMTVALASVGRETDDISSRLFTRTLREEVAKPAVDRLVTLPEHTDATRGSRIEQDAVSHTVDFEPDYVLQRGGSATRQHRTSWKVLATWDGAAAASMAFDEASATELPELPVLIHKAWGEAAVLVAALGGYGPAHLAVRIDARASMGVGIYAQLAPERQVGRTVSVAAPDEDVIASIERELQRSAGRIADEPEVDPERDP